MQWDTCGPEAILREAGGVVTDANGQALKYNVPELRNLSGIIATNGPLHEKIVKSAQAFLQGRG
jgi:3'(2'), 5'-bisphosphate nucleotidase